MRLAIAGLLALLVGCSSEGSASNAQPSCNAFDPGAPSGTVTRAEIDEIFSISCSFSTCHGAAPGQGKLFLPEAGKGDWYANVVNQPSTTHKTMKLVVPSDPKNSFLVQKLGNGLCALAKDCVGGTCGDRMPQASDPLPASDLQKIVTWIANGAPDT